MKKRLQMDDNDKDKNSILLNLKVDVLSEYKAITVIGLIVAIMALIVEIAPDQIRHFIGLDKQSSQQSQIMQTVSEHPVSGKNISEIYEYTIHESQPQFIEDAQTRLSIAFQDINGEKFISLYVSPQGSKSSTHAVLTGKTVEFESSKSVYYLQVLNIDYMDKKIIVQVSPES